MDLHVEEEILPYFNHDIFAKSALLAIKELALSNQSNQYSLINNSWKTLSDKHNHNPVLDNMVREFVFGLPKHETKSYADKKYNDLLKALKDSESGLARMGAKKIKSGGVVFVHSMNNHLFNILERAARYKHFQINIVEHSPFNFGIKLRKAICAKVNLFSDISLGEAVSHSDLVLLGGEGISKTGFIAKHGSSSAASAARRFGIPTYLCLTQWKAHSTVIENQLKHTHSLSEHAHTAVYEALSSEDMFGVITEHGIFKPKDAYSELRKFMSLTNS